MLESSRIEARIEKDTERYYEEKQKALAGKEGIGVRLGELLEERFGWELPAGTDGIFGGFSNWFGMEEKDYE